MAVMLIPCAGNIAIDMQAEFGPIPAAVLPVGKGFAIEKTLDLVVDSFDEIFLGFNSPSRVVQEALSRRYKNVRVIDVGHTGSLAETVQKLIASAGPIDDSVTIQMGDAFHPPAKRARDTVYYSVVDSTNRWVSFQYEPSIGLHSIQLPGIFKERNLGTIFAGKFEISDIKKFAGLLDGRSFYDAIASYFNGLDEAADFLVESSGWLDFGYSSSYFDYRRQVEFNSRTFNSLQYNEDKKSVTKRSANTQKLSEEIGWYRALPNDLVDLYPRIYDLEFSSVAPWMESEYCVAIPLDQLFIYSRLEESVWQRVLRQVDKAISRFRSHPSVAAEVSLQRKLTSMCQDIYETKTLERLKAIVPRTEFADFLEDGIEVNGIACRGLNSVMALLPGFVERLNRDYRPIPSIVHGDLCFSNILYDQRLDHVRLIDPRGSFGSAGIYGDLRYDLAKLLHSSAGHYDFIVNNHFSLRAVGRAFTLETFSDPYQAAPSRLVEDLVRSHAGHEMGAVRFIEALLFLSMVPLHADRLEVQRAFLALGLRKLAEATHELGWL